MRVCVCCNCSAAFGVPVVVFNLLFYMQGFEQSGILVRMVIQIMKGIRWFTGMDDVVV